MNEAMSYKQTRYSDILDRFAESGYAICEVNINDETLLQHKPSDIAGRIRQSAIRFGRPHIRAIARNSRIYLINKQKG